LALGKRRRGRAGEVYAAGLSLDTARLVPRTSVIAGRDVIEAIFVFVTANGPGYGALRLLPSANGLAKAWAISTSLDFDSICAARAKHAVQDTHEHNGAASDWPEHELYDQYLSAYEQTLSQCSTKHAPWYIVRTDDKRRGRLNCISHILSRIPYKKISKKNVKLPKRSTKEKYDDQTPLKGRNFVAERY